jgi:hypothetical protein
MGGGGTNEPGMMRPTQARIARRLLRGFRARGLDILNTSSEPEPDGACCLRKRGVDGNVRQEQLIGAGPTRGTPSERWSGRSRPPGSATLIG